MKEETLSNKNNDELATLILEEHQKEVGIKEIDERGYHARTILHKAFDLKDKKFREFIRRLDILLESYLKGEISWTDFWQRRKKLIGDALIHSPHSVKGNMSKGLREDRPADTPEVAHQGNNASGTSGIPDYTNNLTTGGKKL